MAFGTVNVPGVTSKELEAVSDVANAALERANAAKTTAEAALKKVTDNETTISVAEVAQTANTALYTANQAKQEASQAKEAVETHTHPAQTSVSGNAGTATRLAVARVIQTDLGSTGGTAFDGSTDVFPGVTGILGVWNGGLGNNRGYVGAGQKPGTVVGAHATVEGLNNEASVDTAHAEGNETRAIGPHCHAEGWGTTAGPEAHCHAEGCGTVASGLISHAEGDGTVASGNASHAAGVGTVAEYWAETVVGAYNVKKSPTQNNLIQEYFVVGKGSKDYNTGVITRSNIFRVTTTKIYGTGSYNSSGADYAELFEWADGNHGKEDRAGRFVTLDGDKIRLAGAEDDFILGIISGAPTVVGDVHDDQWQGMFLYDIFGRPIWEDIEVPAETVEEPDPEDPEKTITRVINPAHVERRQKINPDYDSGQKYIPRSERPEWGCVGMMGKLVVVDDGTCEVNGWCKPGEGGVATASGERTKYRVMARLDETHARILIL